MCLFVFEWVISEQAIQLSFSVISFGLSRKPIIPVYWASQRALKCTIQNISRSKESCEEGNVNHEIKCSKEKIWGIVKSTTKSFQIQKWNTVAADFGG